MTSRRRLMARIAKRLRADYGSGLSGSASRTNSSENDNLNTRRD